MKALVVGLGVAGRSAARLLERKGYKVVGYDDQTCQLEELPPLKSFDLAVVSPGVPPYHKLVRDLMREQVEVIGEIELAARFFQGRAVGITGTNGKTTVAMQVAHVLGTEAVGNVGNPFSSFEGELAVVELSSYQLERTRTRFLDAALILNITPDHLDRHKSYEEYVAAKLSIVDLCKGPTFVPPDLAKIGTKAYEGGDPAWVLCEHLGVSREHYDRAMATFERPRHRLELVGEFNGVAFVNDSKGTNVAATAYAVKRSDRPVVLIAGGQDKGGSYSPWLESFPGRVKEVLLIGQAAMRIAQALDGEVNYTHCQTLKEAVDRAFELAKRGDAVLLSPGCASFDQFENYKVRGEHFVELVKERV